MLRLYTNVDGFLACLGLKNLSDKKFKSRQENLLKHIQPLTKAAMKKAAEEEFALAVKAGDIINGKPFITVIVDGSWLKRCFGIKFNSNSGLGVMVGARTGKVLYVGVKNKLCTKCERAESKGKKKNSSKLCKKLAM